ncbi:DsbA family oxidoreductase [Gracilimonas sp.]|uniref:DsbA family oxidoreductase n=1 Tax=Gracilimonas sp. TaxID=1974203 RepID=UPI0032EB8EBB
MSQVTIQITSDFICPWCFVAERRLSHIIKKLTKTISFEIIAQPYELNPTLSTKGLNRKIYRSQKFGSWENSILLDKKVILASTEDDTNFNFEKITVTPNTNKAHRLIWYIQQERKAEQLKALGAIFSGYFTDGRDIGQTEVLADIISPLGFKKDKLINFLNSNEGKEEVAAQEKKANSLGIKGVPHIEINGQSTYGAQPQRIYEQLITKTAKNSETNKLVR